VEITFARSSQTLMAVPWRFVGLFGEVAATGGTLTLAPSLRHRWPTSFPVGMCRLRRGLCERGSGRGEIRAGFQVLSMGAFARFLRENPCAWGLSQEGTWKSKVLIVLLRRPARHCGFATLR